MQTDGKFYLGRIYDADKHEITDQTFFYDPDDLTTHAVAVGMTGSGKTGLCIGLLEEAALNNVPALMIDPKGDITNTLLHFPDLLPADFQPWVNPDEARREGKPIEQAAADEAAKWSKGLEGWEIGKERMQALKNAAHFTVYTPGSTAGIPVSILASLKAPVIPWEENREMLREKLSSTVTAILGLVGMNDIDPVRSREHILLANIFEHAWSQGADLNLSELILQTQNPPFEKLGVFDLNTFFPEKDRFDLAMLLNNILAAPTFQSWIEGQPLDIPTLLYGKDGRPRHSVFYIAHLNDAERMFFVTLLYSAVETWMRSQPGATSVRALVYFDEIFGYLPPIANPPSKQLMLRMLKQARAFGVGQVLVTQNPVDVDYKALSNAGTWFIGKLQTERDKERLLEGLEGASGGSLDRAAYDTLISKLDKRVFLAHNVHEKQPQLFHTRWAINYLAGPLTRNQIPALNELAGAISPAATEQSAATPAAPVTAAAAPAAAAKAPVKAQSAAETPTGSATRPAVPSGIAEYFLPNNLTLMEAVKVSGKSLPENAVSEGLLYKPVLLAQADIRLMQRKYNLDHELKQTALVANPDKRGVVHWEEHLTGGIDPGSLDRQPSPQGRFTTLEAPLSDGKTIRSLESDFVDWAYRTVKVDVMANETLKLYAGPPTTAGQFRKQCSEEARKQRDDEIEKVKATYEKRIDAVRKKLAREKRELTQDESELSQRKMEELGTHAENILGLFTGKTRRVSTSLTKRRMTAQAKSDVEESLDAIGELEADMADLAEEIEAAIDEVEERWGEAAGEIEEIPVAPYKKDILVDLFGVAWMPYHLIDTGGQAIELPGFSAEG
ncbi:MAG: hypothetical protein JXB38_04080 [Anaerolineales bacterium]|nr:hypothetical protein [Anaerolineales bacterium]